jgi:acyl carrier protein
MGARWEPLGATMADGSMMSNKSRIAGIVTALLARRRGPSAGAPGEDLIESGLTSLDMVNLMLSIEAEFDIEIPQSDMTPDNFRSIIAIERLVGSLGPAR